MAWHGCHTCVCAYESLLCPLHVTYYAYPCSSWSAVRIQPHQANGFVYDPAWGGVVSKHSRRFWSDKYFDVTPNTEEDLDFGNTKYNDHHFQYGYYVYAAAALFAGSKAGGSADWDGKLNGAHYRNLYSKTLNNLIRDYANPSMNVSEPLTLRP